VLLTEVLGGGWVSAGTRIRTTCWWLPPGRGWGCPLPAIRGGNLLKDQ
jgi:hypothetical protein